MTVTLSADVPPNTPAWTELGVLLDRRADLTAALDRLGADQREASRAVETAANALAELERLSYTPSAPSATERKAAETALSKARAEANAPWAERRKGIAAAIRDADAEIETFVRSHFGDLADALMAQGAEAAAALDRAAADVLTAYTQREAVAARLSALSSRVRPVRPGDISRSRGERLAAEAERLRTEGGEAPVVLVNDPLQPRHATEIPETADVA
jgi:hypothetical protein